MSNVHRSSQVMFVYWEEYVPQHTCHRQGIFDHASEQRSIREGFQQAGAVIEKKDGEA